MCIYCGTSKYRKIYEQHYGPIPVEDNGRSYHIHHIDGDRSNNNPENLTALSLQEHYEVHLSQKDYAAAAYLASQLQMSPSEIGQLTSQAQKGWGTYYDIDGNKIRTTKDDERVKNGELTYSNKGSLKGLSNYRDSEGQIYQLARLDPLIKTLALVNVGKDCPKQKVKCCHCGKEYGSNGIEKHERMCKSNPYPESLYVDENNEKVWAREDDPLVVTKILKRFRNAGTGLSTWYDTNGNKYRLSGNDPLIESLNLVNAVTGVSHTVSKATCEFCGKECDSNQIKRHEDSCRYNPQSANYSLHKRKRMEKVVCKFCNREISANNIESHERHCKSNPGRVDRNVNEGGLCQHCGKTIGGNNLARHEERCQMNPINMINTS